MADMRVQTDAAKSDRSLKEPDAPKKMRSDQPLLFWRKLINLAVAEAKKTQNGLPTDIAILARWWIADHKPKETEKDDWERSFECACHWLDLDPYVERKRLLTEIDAVLWKSCEEHVRKVVYQHRAAVLSCAGIPTTISRQYIMPLVSEQSYEEVSGDDLLTEC